MQKTVFMAALVLFFTTTVLAQKPEVVTNTKEGWHKIGTAKVDFKTEKDQFIILGADRFKAVRVKFNDAPVHMDDMQIQYEGGKKEDVSLRSDFKEGSESRAISLKNNSAEIRKVTFIYHTVPNSKVEKAQIELWGLK
ncbi:MAG: hypothetical protein ABUT20_33525 [Bacteroidota bacterium]